MIRSSSVDDQVMISSSRLSPLAGKVLTGTRSAQKKNSVTAAHNQRLALVSHAERRCYQTLFHSEHDAASEGETQPSGRRGDPAGLVALESRFDVRRRAGAGGEPRWMCRPPRDASARWLEIGSPRNTLKTHPSR